MAFRDPLDPTQWGPDEGGVTWADWGKGTAAGTIGGVLGSLAGAVEMIPPLMGQRDPNSITSGVRRALEGAAQGVRKSYSPAMKRAVDAPFFPETGQEGIADVGIGTALAAKGMEALPSLVASLVPATLGARLASVAGAGARAAGLVGVGAGRVAEATLSAGGVQNDLRSTIENMTDAQLLETVPAYKGYIDKYGVAARQQYTGDVVRFAPLIAGATSLLTGGSEAMVARKAAGEVVRGGIRRGAVSEAAEEGLQTTGEVGATQEALVAGGLADRDWLGAIDQVLQAMAVGGVMGGAVGGVAGKSPTSRPNVVAPAGTAATTGPAAAPAQPAAARPQPAQKPVVAPAGASTNAGTQAPAPAQTSRQPTAYQPAPQATPGAAAPPSTTAPVGDPQNAPVRSKRSYKKPTVTAGVTATPAVETVQPAAPDAAQQLALDNAVGAALATPQVTQSLPSPPASSADAAATAPAQPPSLPLLAVEPGPQVQSGAAQLLQAPTVVRKRNFKRAATPIAAAPGTAPTDSPAPAQAIPGVGVTPRILPAAPDEFTPLVQEETAAANEAIAASSQRELKGIKAQERADKAGKTVEEMKRGKGWSKAKLAERANANAVSDEIMAANPPTSAEDGYGSRSTQAIKARAAFKKRLRAIIEAADARQLVLPNKFQASKNKAAEYNGNAAMISRARALLGKDRITKDDIDSFRAQEDEARAGDTEAVRSRRRSEGEAASRKPAKDVEAIAAASTKLVATEAEAAEAERASTEVEAEEAPEAEQSDVGARVTSNKRRVSVEDRTEKKEIKTVRGKETVDVAGAASGVREVKLSPEEEARILAGPKSKMDQIRERAKAAAPTPKVMPPKVAAAIGVPKARTPKQRLKAAIKEVNTNPTEAQKEAGNYKKGHYNIQGLSIAIENPKGSERSGLDQNGIRWTSTTPAHYGYIKGTKGADLRADGKPDPVDIYIGPNPGSDFVMVIDQKDLQTGKFDEHKVMFGFNDANSAMQAYLDGFSDSKGPGRFGDWRVMTVAELKAWLKGNTKQPAGATTGEANATEIEVDESTYQHSGLEMARGTNGIPAEAARLIEGSRRRVRLNERWLKLNSTMQGSLANALQIAQVTAEDTQKFLDEVGAGDFDLNHALATYPKVAKMIKETAGDITVYFVSPENWKKMGFKETSLGFHEPLGSYIVMQTGALINVADGYHTILHEGVHAAFSNAIWNVAPIREELSQILDLARSEVTRRGEDIGSYYGLSNIDELVTETLTDSRLQELLDSIPAPDAVAKRLKLDRLTTLWDTFVALVRRTLGLDGVPNSALSAMMKITARLELAASAYEPGPMDDAAALRRAGDRALGPQERRIALPGAPAIPLAEQESLPRVLSFRTLDQIAQLAQDYFGGSRNPVRRVADVVEKIRVKALNHLKRTEPLQRKLYMLQKRYQGMVIGRTPAGEPITVWQHFTELLHDETMTGVFSDQPLASQKHLGKNSLRGAWAREQHPGLAARFAILQQYPDLVQARQEAGQFYKAQQNQMTQGLINNILQAAGINDNRLAKRLHSGKQVSAQDKARLGDLYDHIMRARELRRLRGPYYPLMRRGQFVVRATYKVAPPSNALAKVDDNTWTFDDRAKVEAFVKAQETRPSIRSYYVDQKTGSPFFTLNGKRYRVTKQDADAVLRWDVSVQNRHVEFFDTFDQARAAQLRYEDSANFSDVKGAEEVKWEQQGFDASLSSIQVQALLKSVQAKNSYKALDPASQKLLSRTLAEASLRFMGATRVQARRLPRQYVEGASHDFVRNTHDYSLSTSNYLARIEFQPELDKAMKDMRGQVTSGSQYGKEKSGGRSTIANEVERRVQKAQAFEDLGVLGQWANRAATLSFLRYLFSPAYSVVNSLQPTMLTLPSLAARFGAGTSAKMLFKVYDDIGAWSTTKQGFKATVAKARGNDVPGFMDDIIARVRSPGERRMLDFLMSVGTISRDAGFEVGTLIRSQEGVGGRVDAVLDRVQSIATQMPRAVETINRTVSALAAYRLEMGRSGDHDAAVLYAQEVTNLTQGLYSHTDTPPMFNHPMLRLSLQFKKYGQLIYGLIGHHIGKAIRNTNPGDRAEALKALGMIAATHVVMAGALGLPTEPLKYLVMGLNAFGITELTWQDVENRARSFVADLTSPAIGEVATRGVTRLLPDAIAFDLSSRVGLQDMMSFGEPRSNDPHDIKAFFGELVLGAPGSMAVDWSRGFSDLFAGNFAAGAEKLFPAKIGSNAIRAYRTATEGKKTGAGYQAMEPYNILEGMVRTFGFTPAREAESQEQRAYFRSASTRDQEARTGWMHEWAGAGPGERMKLWGRIEAWNRSRDKSQRLTRSELESYRKRRSSEADDVMQGFRINKRNAPLYRSTLDTYNLR